MSPRLQWHLLMGFVPVPLAHRCFFWTRGSGEEIANFEDIHSKPVSCVRFHPTVLAHLVTGGDDGLLCVLDTEKMPSDDDALCLAVNSEESVERFSFAADGGQRCGRLERLRCEERVQVPAILSHEEFPGQVEWANPMASQSEWEDVRTGHLVDVLYDNQSGAAYVLISSVKGRLCLYHLNLEGASYMSDLTDDKGGHEALVRVSSGFVDNSFIMVMPGAMLTFTAWHVEPVEAMRVDTRRCKEGRGASGAVLEPLESPLESQTRVTAFVKSMSKPGMDGISRAKLDIFREKYPMDDRAFDYLCAAGSDLQIEVLHTFEPKNQTETDYSRQLTGFLTSRSKNQGAHAMEVRQNYGVASREVRRGHVYENAAATSHHQNESRKGDGKGGGRLRAFRARYPMDDRAFDYLQQAEPHVQEMFLSEFQPKRRGSDEDYSASVTSYLKVVKNKIQSNSAPTIVADSRGFDALLDGFRRRYPMDERAFGYLCQQSPDVRQRVIDEFRPKFEGEADYSSLLTSFVKSCRPRRVIGGPPWEGDNSWRLLESGEFTKYPEFSASHPYVERKQGDQGVYTSHAVKLGLLCTGHRHPPAAGDVLQEPRVAVRQVETARRKTGELSWYGLRILDGAQPSH
eukprot:Skav232668  [mRNA]  locus=scaffold698:205106:214384:+ [translate_table: standard]